MFHCLTPSQTNLTAFLLDDFFDKSLGFMLAVWPCRLFLCLGPRCRPVLGRHCSEQNVPPGTDDRARRVLGFLQPLNGLYTHASWQLPEPLKLTNLFEDRQSTPERTLRWLPLCTVAFSNLVAAFHSCLAFHPLIIWFIDCQFVLYIFRRHGGLIPIVSEAIPMIWCGFFLVWLRPRFVLVRCFLCWRNANLAGRFACRRCCRVCFCRFGFSMDLPREAKGFHTFCTLFYRFSHCQDRALERDRPQQRKKNGNCKNSRR